MKNTAYISRLRFILLYVDLLLGNDCEISNYATAVTRQQPINNRGMVFSAESVLMAAYVTMEYTVP
jgi:hypothetical protein